MAKNPYKVLSRPYTKKADIIRAVLPKAHDNCHVYATCASTEQARHLCELLNLGLEVVAEEEVVAAPKRKRKARAR
jgi:hypothetical protein